jgi:DNA-directed RNA polymerase specialized sigma24 family protein
MMQQGGTAATDIALSALIDDELSEEDAERIHAELASDAGLARRFAEMIEATAAIRTSYRDAVEVVNAVAAVYARTMCESCSPADARAQETPRNIDLAVARLPSEQRIALCLAVLEDLSYVEIADVLCTPCSAVMEQLAEARAALAAGLGEAARTDPPSWH